MDKKALLWVFDEPGPRLIVEGLKLYGITEIAGKVNNPVIMRWAEEFDVSDIYTSDEIAWCGLAMCHVARAAGKPVPFTKYEVLRAASWLQWGEKVELKDMMFGDVVVMSRPGGNHVCICIAETKRGTFIGMGGNQSNAYGFAEFDKSRITGVRRHYYTGMPANVRKIIVESNGKLSTNEA